MENSKIDEEHVASNLRGNTLRVYWHVLRSPSGIIGVRETQRALGFSSPALVAYHLEKLTDLGLVKKVHGEYHLAKVVNVGVLKQFLRFGAFILPRYVLYATMFTTLLVFYLTQFKQVDFYSLFALVFGLLATGILWFEAVRAWRQRP